ncbi:MAG: alpha-L-rhamnosidase [Ruminococcaceae bacterium]|nr:alpha-L-rhamnosidase [Oscillospiraceae bacterium]
MCNQRTFSGRWITISKMADTKPVNVFHRQLAVAEEKGCLPENQHILFRKKFFVDSLEKATLFITADDYYKLYINGQFVTQGPAPGYAFHYYYNEIDVTPYLTQGENVIAVHTLYQGLINRVWVSGDDRHGLLFDLMQGENVLAKSDETVLCTLHDGYEAMDIVGYQTQFMECYDSRASAIGFQKPEFDDSLWERASLHQYADYQLFLQPTEPLQISRIAPKEIRKDEKGYWIDFGAVYVGGLSAVASGTSGDRIGMQFSQELDEEGEVRFDMRSNCRYCEEWILSGGRDVLEQYDYKSFRYCRLIVPEGVQVDAVEFVIRHYPFCLQKTCNTPELEDVWNLCVDTLHYGVQEVIQDCPDREKGQYLGDGIYTAITLSVLTNDTKIMEKMIDDALRSAFVNPGLMTCSPCSFMQEIAEYVLMLPGALLVHWYLTKNKAYLAQCYQGVAEVLDFFREQYENKDGLLSDLDKWCVVDWPQEARDGYDFDLTEGRVAVGVHNVINAYYIGAIKTLNRISKILNRPAYRDTKELEQGFVNAFYDAEKKLFRDTPESSHISFPANVFPLIFGLCPDRETVENIISMTAEVAEAPERSAFFTTWPALWAMVREGRRDIVEAFISHPGRWRRMLSEGATRTFEAWGKDLKWNTSLFHLNYAYAALFLTDWGMDGIFTEENK